MGNGGDVTDEEISAEDPIGREATDMHAGNPQSRSLKNMT